MRQQCWIIFVRMRCWVLTLSGYVNLVRIEKVLLTPFLICVVNPKMGICFFRTVDRHTSWSPHVTESRNQKKYKTIPVTDKILSIQPLKSFHLILKFILKISSQQTEQDGKISNRTGTYHPEGVHKLSSTIFRLANK